MARIARMGRIGVATAGIIMAGAASLLAADACAPAKLELYANFETLSVYLPYEGDANANAAAAVEFRRAGEPAWRPAQPLARIRGSRFAGAVFGLKAGSRYEVRVTVSDPDADKPRQLVAGARTRSDPAAAAGGKTIHVSPAGDDSADGTKAKPVRTIQHAVGLAKGGDVVLVGPGTYVESVRITSSGTPRAPITVRGEQGARLIGAAALEAPAGATVWRHVEGDLYKTSHAPRTRYVAVGGKRLYYWKTLDLLRRGSETRRDKTHSVKGGWTQTPDGTLHVRLPDGRDLRRVDGFQVARHNEGIVLDGARHVIVEGLDIGLFGQYCVVVRNSTGCVVRNCVIHNSRHGMSVVGTASTENLIEGCEVYDTSVWEWPWQLCKAHDPEGSAIYLQAGRGNVVRRNRVHGYFNAVVPSMWGKLNDERYNGDLDVHDNEMWDVGDDCLEPEGTCVNQRYWGNRMRGALMGLSIAPITTGPVYFVRNVVFDHHLSAVKLDSNSTGPCFLYHNTFATTVTTTDKYRARRAVNGIGNSGAYHNLTYRNNIIMGTDYAYCDWRRETPRGLSMDYDALFTTSETHFFMFGAKRYMKLDEVRAAAGLEPHGLNVNPGFVNLRKGDLRLRPDSPLVDKGVRLPNINDAFTGRAPDIGAHERP